MRPLIADEDGEGDDGGEDTADEFEQAGADEVCGRLRTSVMMAGRPGCRCDFRRRRLRAGGRCGVEPGCGDPR